MYKICVISIFSVAVFCMAFGAWSAEPPDWLTTGLVAHYGFEENTQDSSTSRMHATKTAGTIQYVTGAVGKALYLDGKTSLEGKASALPKGASERTLCLWAKSEDAKGEFDGDKATNVLFCYGSVGQFGAIYSIVEDGGPWFYSSNWFTITLDDSSLTYDVDFKTTVGQDWQFLCSVYKGGEIINYVNGAEVSRKKVNIKTADGNFYIGVFPDGKRFKFKGGLDEIRVYNRALTEAQIKQLSKHGRAQK